MIENTMTVLPVDGSQQRTVVVTHEPRPGYRAIKAMVEPFLDGGTLEHVGVLHGGGAADMFVDDEGANKGLPRNEAATAVYRANALQREPGLDPESLPAIYGPAVLMARRVWF